MIVVMHKPECEGGGTKNRQPLDGTPYDPATLWAELPGRIAAALPTSGRGAPLRPRALTVWRGVIEREARRAGCPTSHAFVCEDGRTLLPVDKTTRSRREAAVQRLERAEGLETPTILHDDKGFKAEVDAIRRYEVVARDLPAASDFWAASAAYLSARIEVQRAIARATGRDQNAAIQESLAIQEGFVATSKRFAERDAEECRLLRDHVADSERGQRVKADLKTTSLDADRTGEGFSLLDAVAAPESEEFDDPLDIVIRREEQEAAWAAGYPVRP